MHILGLQLNAHPAERLPDTLNLSFPGVAGWQLLAAVPEIDEAASVLIAAWRRLTGPVG